MAAVLVEGWPNGERGSPAGDVIGLLVRYANTSRSKYDGVFESPVYGWGDCKDTVVGIKTDL